jgi:Tat protein secretion system quality control protein TatD with DNase activity
MISYVAEEIARIRGDVTAQQVLDIAYANAKALYGLN